MRIFKANAFARYARKERLTDDMLCKAIFEIEQGLVEANLGSSIYKKRIAKQGQGKSGSFRTIVAFRTKTRSIFLYGFEKNERDNINEVEKRSLKKLAKTFMGYSDDELDKAIRNSALIEVNCDE